MVWRQVEMSDAKMLKFVTRERVTPLLRDTNTRLADYQEIYAPFQHEQAESQAGRCSQCGVPYCQIHCPVSNNIPDWLMRVAENRLDEAYLLSAQTNALPEICGRICPQDRLCEGSCVLEQAGHGTVTIGAIEKHITDTAFENGWVQVIKPLAERVEHIGIIGAGPAGLSAATRLRELGYQVTVYDAHDRAGGLLTYGIPPFKLEKYVVQRRIDWLEKSGVKFTLNCRIGQDKKFSDLRQQHDALLVATGVYQARNAEELAGADAKNIIPALDYLTYSNRLDLGDKPKNSGHLDANGKNIVVIGGGDTAMDCVRTAVRQGAKSVSCLYRRDRVNMPGSAREVANAEQEGVKFRWLIAPVGFDVKDGMVCAVQGQKMRLGNKDKDGRQMIEPDKNEDIKNFDADMVIMALGFEPEKLHEQFEDNGLPTTKWGTLRACYPTMMLEAEKADMQTDYDGVFAAGDIVRGASLVVWAVREGQDAATGIHKWLTNKVKVNKVKDNKVKANG